MSFHFNLKRETTTPPKEGRGRKHCPKEAKWSSTTRRKGSQRQGKGTTAQKKQRREQFPSRFRWYCLPSPPWDGSAFPLSPCGWCCWSSSSLLGGGVPLKRRKELRSVTLTEVQFSSVQFSSVQFSSVQFSSVQFSSVEWWSLLPFSGAAFVCLLLGVAAWPPPPSGRAAFLSLFGVVLVPRKIAPALSAQGGQHHDQEERKPSSTTQQKSGRREEKGSPTQRMGKNAAPSTRRGENNTTQSW